jgi:hypothetical protein
VDTSLVVYRVPAAGGSPERFEGADPDTIVAGQGVWSPDRRQAVYVIDGDLVLWDGRATRKLTDSPVRESSPQWSTDGRTVFFQRDGNVFALGLDGAVLRQLTDIRRGAAPRDEKEPEGQRKFLKDQASELFEFIRSGRTRTSRGTRRPKKTPRGPSRSTPARTRTWAGSR